MKFSYNWLQSFFSESLPEPEKLAELLTMHSFEVEEVEKKDEDHILAIDILPNRAHDCLSHLGVAKEIAALTDSKLKNPSPGLARLGRESKKLLQVDIQDKSLCPRYTAYVVEGVKIADSPEWIKERLASMNQKPISNIVDITNYIMWELGQPLHAFDFDKINGANMNIRLAKQGEKLETLDGAAHDLGADAIIIEDESRIIDLAGIKGGANTQIDSSTKTIIFQAAIFDAARIRKAAQKLGIKTDAAVRYMHGFDQNLPPQALERAIELLRETNPKVKIVQKIDIYPSPQKSKKIAIDTRYVNSLLGTDISKKKMKQILEKLGFGLTSLTGGFKIKDLGFKFTVAVPAYRLDIDAAQDVIEEIGRIYGYENIKPIAPQGTLAVPRRNEQVFWRSRARDILSGFGFSEVYNYSMIPKSQEEDYAFPLLELTNPISDEFRYLRPWLLRGVLKNIASNKKYFEAIKLFEIGRVFFQEGEDIIEEENFIFALTGKENAANGFYEVKGYADEFLKKLGINDFYFDPTFSEEDEKYHGLLLHPARRAIIRADNNFVGFVGEVHPDILSKFGVEGKVYCAEFNFDKISAAAEEEHIYQKPSKYPEVVRDIAVLVPRGTMVVEALNAINSVSGPLLRDIDLFDMFEGENLPEGMKNLAFHLIFQSDKKTLTSQEVDEIMSKITKVLEENLWEVR